MRHGGGGLSAPPLIVRTGAFGDVVLLTTLIHLLHARYGSPVDVIGADAWTEALLADDPAVAEVRLLTSRNTPYALNPSQWRVARCLSQRATRH